MKIKELIKNKKFWIAVIILIVLIILALPIWSCSCGQFPPEIAETLGQQGFCRCWNFFEVILGKAMIY